MNYVALAVLAIVLGGRPACADFRAVVEGRLYRDQQPDYEFFGRLAGSGMRSIISLRQSNVDWERGTVAGYGMRFFSIPVRDRDIPTDDQVFDFLRIATDPANQPALVHCQGGRGRTGIMVAAYRIIVEGRGVAEALREARNFGLDSNKQRSYVQGLAEDYRRGNVPSEALDGIPQGRCAAGQARPDWAPRGEQCLPSCGQLGGTVASSDPCERRGMASAGDAYDADFCCR